MLIRGKGQTKLFSCLPSVLCFLMNFKKKRFIKGAFIGGIWRLAMRPQMLCAPPAAAGPAGPVATPLHTVYSRYAGKPIGGFPRVDTVLLSVQISVIFGIGLRKLMVTGYEANDQPLSQDIA